MLIDRIRLLAVALAAVAVSACGSNGSVAVGDGQASDVTTADFAIAYVKRTLPTDPTALATFLASDDLRMQRKYLSKADVYIRSAATPAGVETNITARVTGSSFYDVRDLDVSADGTQLVFAMRGPLKAKQKDKAPPTWSIWTYNIPTDTLARVIPDDATAEDGEDVSPHFLPDGRILLMSTRQRQAKAILVDEGVAEFEAQTENFPSNKSESAMVLTVMTADGSVNGISQVSYNQSHDIDPSIMSTGRVLFSRWDDAHGNQAAGMALYTANPDGSGLQLLYGAQSHATGSPDATGAPSVVQFSRAREMQDGRILAVLRPFAGTDFGGELAIIDTTHYVENAQLTPAGLGAGLPAGGPGQASASPNVTTVPGPSPGGRFYSASPLWDGTNRALVSWTQCRLADATGTIQACTASNLANTALIPASPLYSVWLLSLVDGTMKPIFAPVEGTMVTDVISLQTRTAPTFIPDLTAPLALAPDLAVGILDIRSVYDWNGAPWPGLGAMTIAQVAALPAAQRPARFLRLEKAVSLPDKDTLNFNTNLAFGVAGNYMRQILGYVPIEADGSVRVRVPANVAFNSVVVDANGRRLWEPNRVWQQFRPGEIGDCNGCYYAPTTVQSPTGAVTTSHGRPGLFATANAGAPAGSVCPGETIAQQKSGWSCNTLPYASPVPSMDVLFDGTPTGEPSISLRYEDLTTPIPTLQSCLASWQSPCRSKISYPLIIKQLWMAPRTTGGVNTTCTVCHNSSPKDAASQLKPPGEQLDLTDDTAQATPALQSQRSYDNLTQGFGFVIAVPDPNNPGQTILVASPTNQPAPIVGGSASASTAFFSIFAPGGTHAGRLTGAELRLLSEWVDIGTQYYNNPFDAPLN